MRTALVSAALLLAACSSDPTPVGTVILNEELAGDLQAEDARRLVGMTSLDPVRITFEDGEGEVEVERIVARLATVDEDGETRVDLDAPPTHLRVVRVIVVDHDGYQLEAGLSGNPINSGTEERPMHTRHVAVSRFRESLTGTEAGTMMLTISPEEIARQ